jgi:hypothetical protein
MQLTIAQKRLLATMFSSMEAAGVIDRDTLAHHLEVAAAVYADDASKGYADKRIAESFSKQESQAREWAELCREFDH